MVKVNKMEPIMTVKIDTSEMSKPLSRSQLAQKCLAAINNIKAKTQDETRILMANCI